MSVSRINRIILSGALLSLAAAGSGCSSIDRLSQIGEKPKLTEIENPTTQPGYKPVQMPMPKPEQASYNANSLWRNGSRAFFKDQRAARIGDLLTVTVNITDKANIANDTQRSRESKEDSGITDFFGSKLIKSPTTAVLPGKLLVAEGSNSYEGKGSVTRQEALQTNVAAVVTQVLPNGNLVVTRDNQYVAVGSAGELLVWRLSDGQQIFRKRLAKQGGFVLYDVTDNLILWADTHGSELLGIRIGDQTQ